MQSWASGCVSIQQAMATPIRSKPGHFLLSYVGQAIATAHNIKWQNTPQQACMLVATYQLASGCIGTQPRMANVIPISPLELVCHFTLGKCLGQHSTQNGKTSPQQARAIFAISFSASARDNTQRAISNARATNVRFCCRFTLGKRVRQHPT